MAEGLEILAVSCATVSRCVALGEHPREPSGPAGRGVALYSSDGGRSWRRGTIAGAGLQWLGGLSCKNRTCYATAGRLGSNEAAGFLLVSLDGGSSWTGRRPLPSGPIGALYCQTAKSCLASGSQAMLWSNDGELHWQSASEPTAGGRPVISSISCLSRQLCLGAGTAPHPGYPWILVSTDGGRRWRSARFEGGGESSVVAGGGGFTKVSCATGRCVAIAMTYPPAGALAVSGDSGRTWRFESLGQGVVTSGVSCASRSGCIVTASSATASPLVALGSGSSWQVRYRGRAANWSSLYCSSLSHCVAGFSEARGLFTTAFVSTSSDEARSWSSSRLPPGLGGVLAISCPTASRCVATDQLASGGAGVLYSRDGGESWVAGSLPAGSPS